jgi:hypothetical protein
MVTKWDSLYFHWIGHANRQSGYREKIFGSCNQLLALLGWNDGTEKELFSLEE